MKIKDLNLKQRFLFLLALGTSIFLLFFVISCTWIGYDVKNQCERAKRKYQRGDCVEVLSALVADENAGFRQRNEAIWALGQLGDARALPVLEKLYTDNIPPREPYDKGISQYELKKAIKLAQGGLNLSAFIWRYNLP